MEAQLRKHNNIATNFNNNELDEQPVELQQLRDKDRQLQNYWENLRKLHRQLRAKGAQDFEELHFKLSSQDRTTTNFDNELATNFANGIELQDSALGHQFHSNGRASLELDTYEKAKELEEHNNFHKWLRELANALEKNLASQLRLQEKVRHQLTLAHRNRTETNFDDELAAKFDKKKKSFQSACFPKLSKGQAREKLASKSSLLGSFISEMRFHIRSLDKKQLAPQEPVTTSSFQEQLVPAECRQSSLTPRTSTSLLSKSSLEEETFSKAVSTTAAWKTRPSAKQLQRKQLGKGTLP